MSTILAALDRYPEALWDVHTHAVQVNRDDQKSICNLFPYQQPIPLEETGFYSVGLHPWHIDQHWQDAWQAVENMASHPRVVMVGEAGLDRTIDTPFSLQEQIFAAHIELSEKLHKPLVIHCVRAYPEIVHWRKRKKATQCWIFHGYQANQSLTQQLLGERKFYFSFGEKLFSERIATLFNFLPLKQCLLETDEGNKCIRTIYQRAALLRQLTLESMVKQIRQNLYTIFHISDHFR